MKESTATATLTPYGFILAKDFYRCSDAINLYWQCLYYSIPVFVEKVPLTSSECIIPNIQKLVDRYIRV